MKKKFAFLIHPRQLDDVARPIPLARILPKKLVGNILEHLPKKFSVYPWTSFDVYGEAEGWIIVVFLTGEQMVRLPRKYVQERVLEAVLYAQNKLGATLVGLGAYTAPITDGGRWLVRQPSVNINITHGDHFSVAIAVEGVRNIISKYNLDRKKIEISIVGAYGLIGRPLTKLLANDCAKLVLIGRRDRKLEELRSELQKDAVKISTKMEDVSNSDIIITSTSYPGALVKPEYLKKGAIVYDIAQPINVTPEVCNSRPDIVRIDGCYAKIPKIDLKVEMGPPKGVTFSCLAETIMQSLMGVQENFVGDIDLSHVQRTVEWQKQFGFDHGDFTNFSQPL